MYILNVNEAISWCWNT